MWSTSLALKFCFQVITLPLNTQTVLLQKKILYIKAIMTQLGLDFADACASEYSKLKKIILKNNVPITYKEMLTCRGSVDVCEVSKFKH